MRGLSRRAVLGLAYVCGLFVLITTVVGVVGILGVRSGAHVSDRIVGDELNTSVATSQTGRAMDDAHTQGVELFLTSDPHEVANREDVLYDVALPRVESDLSNLERLHADDDAREHRDVEKLAAQWAAVREALRPPTAAGPLEQRVLELDTAFDPLSAHIDQLIAREVSDADESRSRLSDDATDITWWVVAAMVLAALAGLATIASGVKRIRAAVEPENEQVEFAETLQVTDTEQEAHELLKRHLERAIPGVDATVLNRNNSADRLEAMTVLAPDSPLVATLHHADPRSCLAIRSARPHAHNDRGRPLMPCDVCGDCPGASSCTPFTVSGQVIGAVLVSGPTIRNDVEEQRIRESVAQAAPVLANLRNLAIAELRAATDSLTGLPNKRAVTDTFKRMVAQASRTITPLSLLMIDLDHFKAINDQYGHPVGDQALANVGAAITSMLRASDFAGRNGGEEFAVLLPDTDTQGAFLLAEKIRAAIADIDPPLAGISITASLGVATYPHHATSTDHLERLADAALYTAKRSGRNRTEIAEISAATAATTDNPTVTTASAP